MFFKKRVKTEKIENTQVVLRELKEVLTYEKYTNMLTKKRLDFETFEYYSFTSNG